MRYTMLSLTNVCADIEKDLTRADCLIEDIEACLLNADIEESQKEIKTFLEHYREQYK